MSNPHVIKRGRDLNERLGDIIMHCHVTRNSLRENPAIDITDGLLQIVKAASDCFTIMLEYKTE